MEMARGTSDLCWLLEHEMRAATRYRRFVSLVMVTSGDGGFSDGTMPVANENGARMLEGCIRTSDELFDMGSYATVVMTETDAPSAQAAVDRYLNVMNGKCDVRFAVGTFPGDGQHAPDFVTSVYQRLRSAKSPGRAEDSDIDA